MTKIYTNRGVVRNAGNIGEAVAMRGLMQHMRASGDNSSNQKPIDAADRRKFCQELDKLAQAALRISTNKPP